MANSYPRRDQARGIWKINQITKNIKDQGTYPQAGGAGKGFTAGGYGSNTIDVVTIKTTGNATDFGDLISSDSNATSCRGNATRVIFVGVSPAGNIIQYITPTTSGNAADYGDLSVSRFMIGGGSNTTRAVNMGGQAPSAGNVIDFMTIPTLGNATDFGDMTYSVRQVAGNCSTTRAFAMGGDNGPSPGGAVNTINMVEISTTGNAIDFGDLTQVTASVPQGCGSFTRGLNGGGQTPSYTSVINTINYGSLGNAIDFGDLTQARRLMSAFSDTQRGVWAGGVDPSADSNVIDFVTIASFGNATDFGDLLAVTQSSQSGSDSHQGIEALTPRAPELYSPTGTVVPNGFGQGDIGVYNGGEAPGSTNVIEFIQISTIGNSQDFGDLTSANAIGGAVSNSTRYVTIGDNTDTLDTHYLEFRTKGNTALFGDLTVRGWAGAGGSNSTRGINYGRANPATSGTANETIDYITTATIGNWTDFGNCNVASYFNGGTNSSTRMVKAGGITEGPNTITDSMEYITIGSTGNGTDFGDLVASNGGFSCGNVSNGTRGIFGGGSVNPANNTNTNVIQYITIASTSNTTDFGDLTVARRYSGSSCNSTRGVWAGGENPSNSNTMDYVTIASTGNAIDYGDLAINVSRHGGASNGHGGLS